MYLIPLHGTPNDFLLGLRNSCHFFLGQLRVMAAPWMLVNWCGLQPSRKGTLWCHWPQIHHLGIRYGIRSYVFFGPHQKIRNSQIRSDWCNAIVGHQFVSGCVSQHNRSQGVAVTWTRLRRPGLRRSPHWSLSGDSDDHCWDMAFYVAEIMRYTGVSENVVYPEKPNGFADHYPY